MKSHRPQTDAREEIAKAKGLHPSAATKGWRQTVERDRRPGLACQRAIVALIRDDEGSRSIKHVSRVNVLLLEASQFATIRLFHESVDVRGMKM
jgi:hypothetical protein